MLKRFLKFLKGDEEHIEETFEGSYLDHLLERLRPDVEQQLESCPEHDPLLLVVVGILRSTMINVWNPKVRAPIVDTQSPGMRPPPPPVIDSESNPADESDATSEFSVAVGLADESESEDASELDVVESEETGETEADEGEGEARDEGEAGEDEGQDEDEDEAQDEGEGQDEDEAQAEAEDEGQDEVEAQDEVEDEAQDEAQGEDEGEGESDTEQLDDSDSEPFEVEEISESEMDDSPPAGSSEGFRRITEEIDVSEIKEAAKAREIEDGDTGDHDIPVFDSEFDETPALDPTIEIEKGSLFEEQDPDERPRLDTEEVLQAGRVYLGLLIENDRLPPDLQLNVSESTVARDLLLGYFIGNANFEESARQLLGLVEQKFSEGLFSQARILLQLFHTDEQTRVNNDRNLFYEDMILRLGIRRRQRPADDDQATFVDLVEKAKNDEARRELLQWLDQHQLVKLHLFVRDPARVKIWRDLSSKSSRPNADDTFMRYLPPRRWRTVDNYADLKCIDQVKSHICLETARSYAIDHLKACYFVLRAVGDTGLEPYLDSFFDWTESFYGLDATILMPALYKRSMMDTDPMTKILVDLYDQHFANGTEAKLAAVTEKEVEKAYKKALKTFAKCDLAEVAPGYYDMGAFVFDELFGMTYPSSEFAFKIHRLT